MNITESPNDKLSISITKFNLDKRLDTDKDPLPEPLSNYPFIWGIISRPKSGKTTYMMSLIILVSPTLKSFGNNKNIDNLKYKFEHLDNDVLDDIEEIARENKDDDENTLVIFDDCSSYFKKNKQIIDKFSHMCKNHRHIGLSMFILSQKYTDLPTGVRNCLGLITMMNTDNMFERDAIFQELPLRKQQYDDLYYYIFQNKDDKNNKYNSMLLDMTRNKSNRVLVYKNFNLLDF
jgi:hypothetical protein